MRGDNFQQIFVVEVWDIACRFQEFLFPLSNSWGMFHQVNLLVRLCFTLWLLFLLDFLNFINLMRLMNLSTRHLTLFFLNRFFFAVQVNLEHSICELTLLLSYVWRGFQTQLRLIHSKDRYLGLGNITLVRRMIFAKVKVLLRKL